MASWDNVVEETRAVVDDGLEDLLGALRIPSVSAHRERLDDSAAYLIELLERDGWSAELVQLESNPIIFAEIGSTEGPSLILYGHHDVQPPDPESAWESPPFEPTIRDGRIFGRGSADNKGQFFCHIFAVRALMRTLGEIPVRLKLILDGQEEVGSPQMPAFVEQMRARLQGALMCVTADGPTREERPEILFGVRGSLQLRLSIRTAATDLHSGNWGNLVPSAAWRLASILAALKGPDGRVSVPGFYDRVIPPTELERQALAEVPFDEAAAQASVGAVFLDGPVDVPAQERLMFLPTLTVAGIHAGSTETGSKAVIPSEAVAYLDVRLVVDQHPEAMFELLRDHLARVAPEARLERLTHFLPSRTPLDTPVASFVANAVRTGFEQAPLRIPCMGGSLPDGVFATALGIPVLEVPYGAHDQRNHAPNENMRLDRINKGTRTSAALILELTGANSDGGHEDKAERPGTPA
jgi:acetylornithine deacetylase/succinyl-diaminopimelate desuccinylase-like protein